MAREEKLRVRLSIPPYKRGTAMAGLLCFGREARRISRETKCFGFRRAMLLEFVDGVQMLELLMAAARNPGVVSTACIAGAAYRIGARKAACQGGCPGATGHSKVRRKNMLSAGREGLTGGR